MSIVGRVISRVPADRVRELVYDWAPSARAQVRERLSIPTSIAWEITRISTLVMIGVVLHAWNLFSFPRYQGDEGVYMSSAWSLMHGSITPYTYNYGHPPLGWALIAAWCELTGGFFTFGTAINTGRVFMVVIYAVSAIFVYLITLRLTQHWQAAAIATALFSYSPLSIAFQREVLLDNIATMWMLVAVYLLVASKSRLRYVVTSAVVFGVTVLTKETMIVLFPAFFIAVWRGITPFQRRYVLLVFTYISLGIVSLFVLVALLKNELFPSGTLLGGTAPHVSMLQTFGAQASRGGQQGSFAQQWQTWTNADFVIMLGGLFSMAANIYLYRKKPWAQGIALLPLFYFLFLARGGVTFAYYIIVVLPLFALNIGLLADLAITKLISDTRGDVSYFARGSRAPFPDVVALATMLALLMIGIYIAPLNHTNFTADGVTPEVQAMQWMANNAPRSSMVVASHYFWLDMRAPGGMGDSYGAPFQNVQMYWNVATDTAILNGVLHNDWNKVDYVMEDSDMALDIKNNNMTLIADAINHSAIVAQFQNAQFWVTIYQVQHTGEVAVDNASRADVITQVSGGASPITTNQASLGVPSSSATNPHASGGAALQARVVAGTLNMRSGPAITAPIVGELHYGVLVRVLTERNGWLNVVVGSRDGWVASAWTAPLA